jgi:hypothetical protein
MWKQEHCSSYLPTGKQSIKMVFLCFVFRRVQTRSQTQVAFLNTVHLYFEERLSHLPRVIGWMASKLQGSLGLQLCTTSNFLYAGFRNKLGTPVGRQTIVHFPSSQDIFSLGGEYTWTYMKGRAEVEDSSAFRVVKLLCMVLQWWINVGPFTYSPVDTHCIAHVNHVWPLGNSTLL